MRGLLKLAVLAGIGSVSVAAGPGDRLTIGGISQPQAGGPIYLKVHSSGDLDGDGVADEAIVRLSCAAGAVSTHYVVSPRDSASGQASGKRTHKPLKIVKEWDAATPQLGRMSPGYNVKENKGARLGGDDGGWAAIELSDAESVCAEAARAVKATKSRSNVQNN